MKRIFAVYVFASVALISAALISSTASAGKLDLSLKMLGQGQPAANAILGQSIGKAGGVYRADVLIKSRDTELTQAAIEDFGGSVRTIIGNVMTASIPVEMLSALENLEEVEGVEASQPMKMMLDKAVSSANANVAAISSSYDGTNVIVGVIDSGLDYSRADFKNADGTTRVQYLRFQTASSSEAFTITECAKDYIDEGKCTAIPETNDSAVGHGTHVTGIAAGNGGGTSYIGMAPKADIMLVRNDYTDDITDANTGTTYTASVLDGVNQIFQKADIIDKPAVVNLSQGTHIGAHDNTSVMETGINNAVAGQYSSTGKNYGRVVVAAAGNENVVTDVLGTLATFGGGIHGAISVNNGEKKGYRFWALADPSRTPMAVDVWFSSSVNGDNCTVGAKAYQFSGTGASAFDVNTSNAKASIEQTLTEANNENTPSSITTDNKAAMIMATDNKVSLNSKPRALVLFGPWDNSAGDWNSSWTGVEVVASPASGYFVDITIAASGGPCVGNMWIEGGGTYAHFLQNIEGTYTVAGTGSYTLIDGDNTMSVAIPATASGVIAVGAYLEYANRGSSCPNSDSGSCWLSSETSLTYDAATDDPLHSADGANIFGGTPGSACPFSSLGPTTADDRTKPDIYAPGDPIVSVRPTGFTPADPLIVDSTHYKNQGTSQSSPMIAGITALMLQKNHILPAATVKTYLTSSATSAAGILKVNAEAAVAKFSADTSALAGTGNLKQSDLSTPSSSSKICNFVPGTIFNGAQSLLGIIAIILPCIAIGIKRRDV